MPSAQNVLIPAKQDTLKQKRVWKYHWNQTPNAKHLDHEGFFFFFHFGKAFFQSRGHGYRWSEIPPQWADDCVFITSASIPLFSNMTRPWEPLIISFLEKLSETGWVNTTVGCKGYGVFLWHGSPLARSQLESTIARGCKQTGQSPKGWNKDDQRSRKLNLRSEGNGERRLREDLPSNSPQSPSETVLHVLCK